MNNEGFIVLHRKLLDWEWFSDPATAQVWTYLLLRANWKPNRWRGIEIRRGETLETRTGIAKATGLSQQSVRTAINHLKSTGEITTKSTRYGTLIYVVNYCIYQVSEEKINQPTNHEINQEPTTNQPTANHTRTKKQSNKETINKSRGRSAPTLRKISDFIGEEKLNVDPSRFWKYYNDWGKPFPRDWRNRCRKWSETERPHTYSEPIVIEAPEWLKYTNVEYDPDKIDF